MKQLLCEQFFSTPVDPILFQQYRNCEQGNRSVIEYGDEFQKLSLMLDVGELKIQRSIKFLSGLKKKIREEISILMVLNLSNAINLATKIECDLMELSESTLKKGLKRS